MQNIIASFISILATVLTFAIIIRALMSWFVPQDSTGFSRVLSDITEPILSPIRRILPTAGGIDFSPWIALIAIQIASHYLVAILATGSA